MSLKIRLAVALAVAIVVSATYMTIDTYRGAEWKVPPQQVEAAQAQGKPGVETGPGTVAVRGIRSETADLLVFQWLLAGLAAGGFVFFNMRPRKTAG